MRNETSGRSSDEVPEGPYFHGTRFEYQPGALLPTEVVSTMEGDEDLRLVCFATTSQGEALQWAYQRDFRHGGDMLYVYEVEMYEPLVDTNMHRLGSPGPITSVMSPVGRVIRLVAQVPTDDHPATFG